MHGTLARGRCRHAFMHAVIMRVATGIAAMPTATPAARPPQQHCSCTLYLEAMHAAPRANTRSPGWRVHGRPRRQGLPLPCAPRPLSMCVAGRGNYDGPEAERLAVLKVAALMGAPYVDVEFKAASFFFAGARSRVHGRGCRRYCNTACGWAPSHLASTPAAAPRAPGRLPAGLCKPLPARPSTRPLPRRASGGAAHHQGHLVISRLQADAR